MQSGNRIYCQTWSWTRYHSFISHTRKSRRNNLLPLVRDLHCLALCTNRCVRRRLLRRNRKLLVLELGKGHGPDRNQTDFLEALEALEDGREVVLVDVARDILEEQRLVGSHIFVGNCGGPCLCGAGFLCGDCRVGLRLCVFFCALEVYGELVLCLVVVVVDAYPSA
jgi:hypothetical protein